MNVFTDLYDRNDLMAIFDPLVTDILRLIDDQVKSTHLKRGKDGVKVILPSPIVTFDRKSPLTSISELQGHFPGRGFGSSQFLKSKIQTQFPGVQVLQPTDTWAAVVK
jgi:hypothetical protein